MSIESRALCDIVAKNDAHRLVIVYSPRLRKYALIANPFKKFGKRKTVRQSEDFRSIFDLFTEWCGGDYVLY